MWEACVLFSNPSIICFSHRTGLRIYAHHMFMLVFRPGTHFIIFSITKQNTLTLQFVAMQNLTKSAWYKILHIRCALDISRSVFVINSRETLHSSSVRARYGVSFVSENRTEVLSMYLCGVHYRIIHNRDISRVYIITADVLPIHLIVNNRTYVTWIFY